ncbi:protein FAR1-RELATED SEQUENCE 5-like [Aristolochia californica]|uniref:protein FAR1-RELATED SEQUENCE 5-like n=1 Tax=Aristolochia californica TaxID=171875 RepID=UPI0035D746C2
MENTPNPESSLVESQMSSLTERPEGFLAPDPQSHMVGVCVMADISDRDGNLEPYVGMEFESEEAAKILYNAYARRVGFGSRVSRNRRSRKDGTNIARRFVCCKEGYRLRKHESNVNRVKRPRAITREGCEAMILVKKNDLGKWVVTKFVKEHNHALLDPIQVLSLRSHKNTADASQNLANSFDPSRPGSGRMMFGSEGDGIGNFGFVEQEGRSHVQTLRKRKMSLGKDAQNVLDYFRRMKSENPSFYYGIQIDEDQNLCSIFWADTRSRMACNYFGDVVYIDTTYRTSRYEMPFAIFSGINHHQQSTLFGCALLLDDTESSFVWVFKTWLESTFRHHPVLVITDHDAAIEAAVMQVFPKTRHCFCKWSILNKAQKHFGHLYQGNPTFQAELQKCIDLSESIPEFESCWLSLMERYGIGEDMWLQSLYNVRQKWVPVYLHDIFCAQIYTSQRTESINVFFDGCVNSSTTLQEFVTLYEKALDSLYAKELEEDVLTMHSKPTLKTKLPIEKQVADIFTRTMFSKFQEEIFESLGYVANKVKEFGVMSTYAVARFEEQKKGESVTFNAAEMRVSCSCHMFEVAGILCRHVLKVFTTLNIMTLPPHYILTRWTRDAKSGVVLDERGIPMQANCRESVTLRFNNLCKQAIRCVEEGATSVETYDVAARALREAWEKIVNKKAARASQLVTPPSGNGQGEMLSMQNEPENSMSQIIPQDSRQWHSWLS